MKKVIEKTYYENLASGGTCEHKRVWRKTKEGPLILEKSKYTDSNGNKMTPREVNNLLLEKGYKKTKTTTNKHY